MSARAVFFDRDGTLMEEGAYCADAGKVRVYAGVAAGIRELETGGIPGVHRHQPERNGRGWMSEAQYRAVQAEAIRQIGEELIDGSYFCADAPGTASAGANRRRACCWKPRRSTGSTSSGRT